MLLFFQKTILPCTGPIIPIFHLWLRSPNISCSCVSNDQCESGDGLLDVRGAEEKTCEDKSKVCCHKTSLKVPVEEEPSDYDYYGEDSIPCESLTREGYR